MNDNNPLFHSFKVEYLSECILNGCKKKSNDYISNIQKLLFSNDNTNKIYELIEKYNDTLLDENFFNFEYIFLFVFHVYPDWWSITKYNKTNKNNDDY